MKRLGTLAAWLILLILAVAAMGCTTWSWPCGPDQPMLADQKAGYPKGQMHVYYYYPHSHLYFDPDAEFFYWMMEGQWYMGKKVPREIVIHRERVAFKTDAGKPYLVDKEVLKRFQDYIVLNRNYRLDGPSLYRVPYRTEHHYYYYDDNSGINDRGYRYEESRQAQEGAYHTY